MLTVLNHPLITHKLGIMRDVNTTTKDFRQNLDEIAGLMAYEITRDLPTEPVDIQTPISICKTVQLSKEVVLVPILRAGLGMVEGIRSLIPTSKVAHVGVYRDEVTLKPVEYFAKFPVHMNDAIAMILDPMLATGGSACAAIDLLKQRGAQQIKLVCLVGAPEGVKLIEQQHPDVSIYLAALDSHLNEVGYIVPGLGDAGDRIYGTK